MIDTGQTSVTQIEVPIKMSATPVVEAKKTESWSAAIQNLGALAAVVSLTLADKISGEVASGMILAITGVIALPALRRSGSAGAGAIGTIGVVALCWPAIKFLPFGLFR